MTNADGSASGTVTLTFNVTRDASNAISSGTLDINAPLSGFPANTTVIGSHIHTGAAGINGPILVDAGLTAAAPLTLAAGTGTIARTAPAVTTGATIQSIIDNPAGFYFNVHTALNTGGAIRGQLRRN